MIQGYGAGTEPPLRAFRVILSVVQAASIMATEIMRMPY